MYKSDGRNKSDVEDEVVFVLFISVGIFLYVQLKFMWNSASINIILNRKGADQVLATYSSGNPFIEPLKASKETYHTDTKGESKNSTEIAENKCIGLDS